MIQAQGICFLSPTGEECGYCKQCPIFELTIDTKNTAENCQKLLAENTIKKLKELVELLDDKVNHHYYDTLESLQEMNTELANKLDSIKEIIDD